MIDAEFAFVFVLESLFGQHSLNFKEERAGIFMVWDLAFCSLKKGKQNLFSLPFDEDEWGAMLAIKKEEKKRLCQAM